MKAFLTLVPPQKNLSKCKCHKHLPFLRVTYTYLHTVQCSPSKTWLCSGAGTHQRGGLPQAVVSLAVLPLASYSGYSERALDPHRSDRRNGRLPKETQGRKKAWSYIYGTVKESSLLNLNYLEKVTTYIYSEYWFSSIPGRAQGDNICKR